MTSFPVEFEPPPQPRLAAAALLVHAAAAALPWVTRCPPGLSVALSLSAIASLWATLARVPGRHCRLQVLACENGLWHARSAGGSHAQAVLIGPGTRVYAGLVVLELVTGRGRLGWLLPRRALNPVQFRRLKARLRLAC
jgi:hypothetical protein